MEETVGCCGFFHVLVFLAVPNEPKGLKFVLEVFKKNKFIS